MTSWVTLSLSRYFPAYSSSDSGTMSATTVVVPLPESTVSIVRQCGPTLIDVLLSKFGCMTVIEGVDFEQDPTVSWQRKSKVVAEKRFTCALRGAVKVSVWKDDLVNLQVDAVVNAANPKLQHYGGLALALSIAGGPQVQKDSDDYIKQHGDLQTGDAVIGDSGSLPCKKLIHAVGPCLPPHSSKSEVTSGQVLLEKAIRSILDKVREHHLKTVAIPAISSGLFNFPLPLCADTIVSTVKHYYDHLKTGHRPEEILLVNNDEPSVRAMEKACREILHSHPPKTHSYAAVDKTISVHIDNVLLTLTYGKIEEQQTDVIVNTARSDYNLSFGEIANAVLKKAGPGIQQEIFRNPKKDKIIATAGHNLQCKKVYHTFCTEKGAHSAEQTLSASVLECLWTAVSDRHSSIAFPAIGTGALGFSKKHAAHIMSDAVADFALKSGCQLEVVFVIFPSDKDTFKAFEQEMGSLRKRAQNPSFPQAGMPRDHFHDTKPPTPHISLIGPSDELTREARRWLTHLLQSSGDVTICNNFIQHLGDNEYVALCQLTEKGIFIEESFENGHSEIKLIGSPSDFVVVAAVQVEAMLCHVQKEFVREEERAMHMMSAENVSFFKKKTVSSVSDEFNRKFTKLKKDGLRMVKLEKVENPALEMIFEVKKKQLQCYTHDKMFQRIPAQFCDMISRIGFHTVCAPPAEPAFGEGIYFTGTVKRAMQVWKQQKEEYVYFVEADVLKGKSTSGKPGLIVPPARETNPQSLYDSVSGGPDVCVIFSGYQALPKYIITCEAM
ncbi:poly [ADP-ribose] polymerase 9-like [Solea senegalensis]|uniref:Poly [ADP-ribose] polymerase 9-like n=2 Tax=Solea senegalensis TaxID=28829 RepID=A0AAV6RDC4_SOLSE|nr:protein mono-ADP-ribosyltransferase PARP9 isoform X1 [Solea senegalensis]KAG7503542.1 poly [ADP-ribose] polymerase 9-like [Solea senegalensis]